MDSYVAPFFQGTDFNCPHCHTHAQQYWMDLYYNPNGRSGVKNGFKTSTCNRCDEITIWQNGNMIYPVINLAPPPHADMSIDPKKDYVEASEIVAKSPRSACLLLRICIEKIVNELISGSGDLNEKIGKLVAQGLDTQIQQALDTLRVIGGQAGHPLEMDLRDDKETANALFELVNLVVDLTITRKKKIGDMYSKLPPSKIDAINKRDGKII